MVVMRSATARTAMRNGVIRTIQRGRIRALIAVLNLIGKLTAMVFGVTSPISSSSGTMIKNVDPANILLAEKQQQDRGHVDRRGDIDQLVAAQDGNDQAARLIEHGVNAVRIAMARLSQFLQIDPTEGKQRGFRTGKYR